MQRSCVVASSRLISLPPDLLAAVAQYILWHEWFALFLAARGGHNGITEALRALIAAGADVDSRHTGCLGHRYGNTALIWVTRWKPALHWPCWREGRVEIAQALVAAGADVHAAGRTATRR